MTSRSPYSILIVEDERIVAMDIQQTLRDLGHHVFAVASSSEEAIARASERRVDLALMDVRIRGERDGIETAEILKAKFGIPVVYLTAHADPTTVERAAQTEPYGYLLKPVRPAELRSVVEISLYKVEMEARLRERDQQQRELADRLASLGTLASRIARELSGPLAAIAAREGSSGSRQAETADAFIELQTAANRIGRVVSELGTFFPPSPSVGCRADVLRCIEWATRLTIVQIHEKARLVTTLGSLPKAQADEVRLGQVLVNLLVNAAQAILPGSAGRNEVRIDAFTDPLGEVVIEVRDTGAGVPREHLARLFSPSTNEGVEYDTGLLACRGILRSMGGEISVDSEVGQGTTVKVTLAAADRPSSRLG